MASYQTGAGVAHSNFSKQAQLTHREGVELQCYLFELEETILRLTQHIAELESAFYAMENERMIAAEAEAKQEEKDDVPAGSGGLAPPATGASIQTSASPAVLFRFDPQPPPTKRGDRPVFTMHGPKDPEQTDTDSRK